MKALMSKRAVELLADPSAKGQLRLFMMNKQSKAEAKPAVSTSAFIVTRNNGKTYKVQIVPKAGSLPEQA